MSAMLSTNMPRLSETVDPGSGVIRVLILCPITLYRDGIADRLRREPGVEVVCAAAGPNEILDRLREPGSAVVLLDAAVPNQALLVRHMLETAPCTTVLALALDEDEERVLACAEAGISGYVPGHASLDDLVSAVRRAARGEVACPPRIAACLFRRLATLARERHRPMSLDTLTPREREVLALIGEGLSNKAIARRLGIGIATVKNHVHRVLDKLGVARRDAAAARVKGLLPVQARAGDAAD